MTLTDGWTSCASSLLNVPPRQATQRTPDAPTLGADVDAVAAAVSRSWLYDWQRYVADVAGELLPDGRRRYSTVVLRTPRQQGKSTLLDAVMVHNSRRPRAGRLARRKVVYVAQTQDKAKERIIVELEGERLTRSPVYAGRYKLSLANSGQRITWRDSNGFIHAAAPSKRIGHGLSEVDDVLLDEAWALPWSVIAGMQPTQAAAEDPQLWVVSTPGEGDDDLLLHYEDVGVASLTDPDTAVAFFDWSATEDDDRSDPAVWARVMPSWGVGWPTVPRVRSFLEQLPPGEFDRAYLARRPAADAVSAFDPAAWAACGQPHELTFSGPVVAAFAIPPSREWASLAVVGHSPDGRPGVVVDRQPGTRWLADAVLALAHRPDVSLYATVADRANGVGGAIDQLALRGLTVTELGAADVASAAGTLHDLLGAQGIVHQRQPVLSDQVAGSRRRKLAAAWALHVEQSTSDVDALMAVSFAVARFVAEFPSAVLGGIR